MWRMGCRAKVKKGRRIIIVLMTAVDLTLAVSGGGFKGKKRSQPYQPHLTFSTADFLSEEGLNWERNTV